LKRPEDKQRGKEKSGGISGRPLSGKESIFQRASRKIRL
jgi:hypothetical protein